MNEPMSPTDISVEARRQAAKLSPRSRYVLEAFADWIDERERVRMHNRDNTVVNGFTLTREKVYDLSIRVHKWGGGEKVQNLKGWVFEGKRGFNESYLAFRKLGPEGREWQGIRREINRDDVLSVSEAA